MNFFSGGSLACALAAWPVSSGMHVDHISGLPNDLMLVIECAAEGMVAQPEKRGLRNFRVLLPLTRRPSTKYLDCPDGGMVYATDLKSVT
jgi:hypothetical protein